MTFIGELISSNDSRADSIIVLGIAAMVVLSGLQIYDAIIAQHEFSPLNYAAASGTLLAAIGGGKGMRDRLTPSPPPSPGDNP